MLYAQVATAFPWLRVLLILCGVGIHRATNTHFRFMNGLNHSDRAGLPARTILPAPDCMMEHVNRVYCLSTSDSSDFDIFIDSCHWSSAAHAVDLIWLFQSFDGGDTSTLDHSKISLQACRSQQVPLWVAFRFGPYETVGGNQWYGIGAVLNSSQLSTYMQTPLHAFTTHILGTSDGHLKLMGYPPIHQHHNHIGEGFSMYSGHNVQNHGDSQCDGFEGGTQCLIHNAPSGLAWILSPRLMPWAEFNDVRPPESSALRSWAFIALKSAPQGQHLLQIRAEDRAAHDYSEGHYLTGTYLVRTDVPSFIWRSFDLAKRITSQDIVEAYMHTHPQLLVDLWVFQGKPQQVFSEMTPETKLHYGSGIVEDVVKDIRARQTGVNPATLVCSYMHSSRSEYVCAGGECSHYQRKARCPLNTLKPDFVISSFFGAGVAHFAPRSPWIFPMHTTLRVFYAETRHRVFYYPDTGNSKESMLYSMRQHMNISSDPDCLRANCFANLFDGEREVDPVLIA